MSEKATILPLPSLIFLPPVQRLTLLFVFSYKFLFKSFLGGSMYQKFVQIKIFLNSSPGHIWTDTPTEMGMGIVSEYAVI